MKLSAKSAVSRIHLVDTHEDDHGIARSDKWPAVERAHLAKHPQCAACVRIGAPVAVHHVMPFHICIRLGRPDLELDERNLITLCAGGEGEHHLLLGHLDDWESMNLNVRRDARMVFHGMSARAIRANAEWRAREAKRAVAFEKMSRAEREGLRVWMAHLPPRLG